MNKKILALALSLLICSSLFGCTPKQPEEQPVVTPEPTEAAKFAFLNPVGTIAPLNCYSSGKRIDFAAELAAEYVSANSAFTVSMLNALGDDWTGVYSPITVQIALELLSNGADDETCAQLLNAVCPGMTREDVNLNAGKLLSMLVKSQNVTVSTAVITNNSFRLSQAFANTAADYYSAAVGALDFSDPSAALHEINTWVKDNTDGIIENMLSTDEISPETAIVLINALTLNLNWAEKFYALRGIIDFAGTNGVQSTTMIGASGQYGYGEFENGCMVTIPYEGGQYAMAVILPDKGVTPAAAVQSMMKNVADCTISNVVIKMPRIHIDSRIDILGIADKLGLDAALNGIYSEMISGESPMINAVLQQNSMDVNEKGTIAASATAVVATKGEPVFSGDHTVVCDRPYAMIIYHVETGTVMFVSIVNNLSVDTGSKNIG